MRSIPVFKLIPEPANQEARGLSGFKWADPIVGTRHQLGGRPEFVEESDWPRCPSGHGKMTFYAQLDSISDDICIADCGIIQVYLCFDCFAAKSIVQPG